MQYCRSTPTVLYIKLQVWGELVFFCFPLSFPYLFFNDMTPPTEEPLDTQKAATAQQQQTQHTGRRARPQSMGVSSNSTKPPRMVDRELQRIKSLAVVSGRKEVSPPNPTPSTSSSIRSNTFADVRSNYTTYASSVVSTKSSTSSLNHDYMTTMTTMTAAAATNTTISKINSNSNSSNKSRLQAAELDDIQRELLSMYEEAYLKTQRSDAVDKWVVSVLPSVSTHPQSDYGPAATEHEDEHDIDHHHQHHQPSPTMMDLISSREQEMHQTLQMYLEQKEYEASKARQLAEIVLKQEQLIEHMQGQLDEAAEINESLERRMNDAEWADKLNAARQQLAGLTTEIEALRSTKEGLESMVVSLWSELEQGREQIRQSLQTTEELDADVKAQRVQIDGKLQLFKQQILEKDTLLQKYRIFGVLPSSESSKQQQQQHLPPIASRPLPPPPPVPPSNRSADHSTTTTPRSSVASSIASTKPPDRPHKSSKRESSNSAALKRTLWTGGPLPPPAPPPTQPLPPIPQDETPQAPPSPLATASLRSSSSVTSSPTIPSSINPPEVADDNNNRASIASSAKNSGGAEQIVEMEASYREFTEQLQARLSISKEIDELNVWQPNDLEEMKQRFAKWDDEDAATKRLSRDSSTFWRGMKKKLRV